MVGIEKITKLVIPIFLLGLVWIYFIEKRADRFSRGKTNLSMVYNKNRMGSSAGEGLKEKIVLEEFRSFLRYWRKAKREKRSRVGSPYLFSVCMHILRVGLDPDPPHAIVKRLVSLAPRYPERGAALFSGSSTEGEDNLLGMTREQRLAYGDSALKMAININIPDSNWAERVIGNLKTSLSCYGGIVRFSSFLKNGIEKNGFLFPFQIKATLDFSDQWSSINGERVWFDRETVPGAFFSFDSKGRKKERQVNYLHGKVKVPFYEGNYFQCVRLDLRRSYDVLFFAIRPKEMKEAEEDWPILLGEKKIFEVMGAISGENPRPLVPLNLYLPKFGMENVLKSRVDCVLSTKRPKGGKKKQLTVDVKNETRFDLDAGGISFHTTVSVLGIGVSTVKYKTLKYNTPFLFVVYHRGFRSFLILGEFLGD